MTSGKEATLNRIVANLRAIVSHINDENLLDDDTDDKDCPFDHTANAYVNARNGAGFKVTHNGKSEFGLLFKEVRGDKNVFIHIPLRRWELRSVLISVVRHLERGGDMRLRFGFEEKEIPGTGYFKVYALTFKLNYNGTVTISADETTAPSDINDIPTTVEIPQDSISTEIAAEYLGTMFSRSDITGPKWKILAILDYFRTLISLIDSTR